MARFWLLVFLPGLLALANQSSSTAKNLGQLAGQTHGISTGVNKEIERGIKTLHDLLKDKEKYERYARALGFDSVEEAARATAGRPLPVYRVSILRLGKYQKGTRPEKILDVRPRTLLIPILADGQIRSSFMIAESANSRTARIIGQGASNLLLGRKSEYLATIEAAVLIPDLRLRFLARDADKGFVMIPMKDYPIFELKADTEIPADQLFTKLAPIARRVAQAIADNSEPDEPKDPRLRATPHLLPTPQ